MSERPKDSLILAREGPMLRHLGNPSDLKASLEREIAEARQEGLDGRDLLQAVVGRFPKAPLEDVMAAWEAVCPAAKGKPGPGQALREIHGAETMPPAALDGDDPRIAILQQVELGRSLCLAPETFPQGMLCMLHAGYKALLHARVPPDSLAPFRQYIVAKSGGGDGEWGARAFMALALEALLIVSEKPGPAAKALIAELNCPAWLRHYRHPHKTLQEWHANLLANRRVPRDGEHQQILAEVLPHLEAARQLKASQERDNDLRQAAKEFVRCARERIVHLYF